MEAMDRTPVAEPLDNLVNSHRIGERERIRLEGIERLLALGVRMTGTETSDEVGDILDAVESFEHAVESRGGDLMVDEGPGGRTTQPDDPAFVLPTRAAFEPAEAYFRRLELSAARLHHRPPRFDI